MDSKGFQQFLRLSDLIYGSLEGKTHLLPALYIIAVFNPGPLPVLFHHLHDTVP
jgi:hypothetical protein